MLVTLRWLIPSLVPALLAVVGIYLSDKRREPKLQIFFTFALGAVSAALAHFVVARAAAWTGLTLRASAAGDAGTLVFLFGFSAPLCEALKVAACWPAYRSHHFDEPYDGVVYACVAAMGFASCEAALRLHASTAHAWLTPVVRVLLALPAHLFFAAFWGYALGRSQELKRPGRIFPAAWLMATVGHAFYAHLVFGRGPGALLAAAPLLAVMGIFAWVAARDLASRGERDAHAVIGGDGDTRLSRVSVPPLSSRRSGRGGPPSLQTVRDALTRHDQPVRARWIVVGALVTMGAMMLGLAASVALAWWAHIDFASVDEHDMATTAPVALLGAGLLAAFPLSGFLIARASSVPTLLEPAMATGLALVTVLVLLGMAAPVALVFALAFSPVALILACAGAWVGRPIGS